MIRVAIYAAMLVVALPAGPAAHQLDEYLQAARIALARDRIVLEIELTPGANIAGEIVARLDRNDDGVVQPLEARAYGTAVIGDLDLTFEGRPVQLVLEAVEVPLVDEMRRGMGTIQLTVAGAINEAGAGTRHVKFTNRHHPATSVYLANALIPGDRDVQVVAQRRDHRQQELEVEYAIASRWSVHVIWMLFGVTLVISRIAAKRA